jgi:hypothetical protein
VPTIPRIDRAIPRGEVTRPADGLPVWALIIWHDPGGLREEQVPAIAVGWTQVAVEIAWESKAFGRRTDWVPATYVWRAGQPRPENPRWEPRVVRKRA